MLFPSATESIPQHWGAMNPTQLCGMFTLKAGDVEYNDVLGLFKATCAAQNVLKVCIICLFLSYFDT